MADISHAPAKTFGEIIKEKLLERNWSQRHLAKVTNIGPTYLNYLIRGKNPASNLSFQPIPLRVELIARELGIPLDEAFAAAGCDPPKPAEPPDDRPFRRVTPSKVENAGEAHDSETGPDKRLFDIAYRAALAAVKGDRGSSDNKTGVTIDLSEGVYMILHGLDLGERDLALYSAAFKAAYESAS